MSRRHLSKERRRAYDRDWARQARYKEWLARNAGHSTCQWQSGSHKCGGTLKHGDDGSIACLWCALKHAGLCRDCLTPIEKGPNALRCHDCWIIERNVAERRYSARYPGKKNKEHRDRLARWKAEGDPRYAQKMAYKKLYRALNPDRVRQWKKTERENQRAQKYQKEYRAKWGEKRRTVERDRHAARKRGERVTHPCLGCGRPLTGRWKKCRNCKIGKYVVALDVMAVLRTDPALPIYGPVPTYADFVKNVSTPQKKSAASRAIATRDPEWPTFY